MYARNGQVPGSSSCSAVAVVDAGDVGHVGLHRIRVETQVGVAAAKHRAQKVLRAIRFSGASKMSPVLDHVPWLIGWYPRSRQGPRRSKGVLTDYIEAAMRRVEVRRLESDSTVYAAIRGFEYVWGAGVTPQEAQRDLRRALEWCMLTFVFDQKPLPRIDKASLEILEEDLHGRRTLYPAEGLTHGDLLALLTNEQAPDVLNYEPN